MDDTPETRANMTSLPDEVPSPIVSVFLFASACGFKTDQLAEGVNAFLAFYFNSPFSK